MGARADTIWFAYLREDESGKKEIESLLEIYSSQLLQGNLQEDKKLLIPPSKEKAAGEYYIGDAIYDGKLLFPFGLKEEEWIRHINIFGQSGAGKTNLSFLIMRELARKKKPFLFLDWKRNGKDLMTRPEFEDLLVFTVGRNISPFRFNPLIPPPDADPKAWLKKLIEVIAHAYCLGNGVIYLLQQAIDDAYKKYGIYTGNATKYPTFRDIHEWLKNYPAQGRETNWLTSAMRATASLCFGSMDSVVNSGQNYGMEEILKQKVILELDALTQSDKIFFIESLILWIHDYRLTRPERENFSHCIICEEAHHILSGERHSLFGGESVIIVAIKELRELNQSFVVVDQMPSQISPVAMANSYCTIAMNLKNKQDVSSAASAMLLDNEQKEYLGKLEVGEAIVKLQGRILSPFMIHIPEFPIQKGSVDDTFIKRRMKTYFSNFQPQLVEGSENESIEVQDKASEPANTLSEREKQFLLDVFNYPRSGTVERYNRMHISCRQGDKIKRCLLAKGLFLQEDLPTQNGRLRIIRLTDQTRKLLENQEKSISEL